MILWLWMALAQDTGQPVGPTEPDSVPVDVHVQAHAKAAEQVEQVTEHAEQATEALDALIVVLEAKATAEGTVLPAPVDERMKDGKEEVVEASSESIEAELGESQPGEAELDEFELGETQPGEADLVGPMLPL